MTREIIRVNSEQIYAIDDLEKKCFEKPWTPVMIEADMMHEFSDFLLLKVDDKNVGYLNMWTIDNSIELNRICIDPDFRRKGYADELMNHLIDLLVEKNLDRILLEVAADNHAAIKLYDKYGFKDIHIREKYYDNGADALIKELVRDDI
ncbi:MAG: ribosomal protein S18-alanine N-acetyltransferase [Tissierellia bacterium]|nr:ribosomal protein S18-alanine N-acetyltransferase [Tissierellia bacterium]